MATAELAIAGLERMVRLVEALRLEIHAGDQRADLDRESRHSRFDPDQRGWRRLNRDWN